MKIAIAVNPEQPTPPKLYGGTQRRADFIARRLKARGHSVILLCGPGSKCPVDKVMTSVASMSAEWEFVKWLRDNKGWDCLLDMTANHLPSQNNGLPPGTPTLAMMSGDHHKRYPHDMVRNRMYVSQKFADYFGCSNYPVVHNIPCDDPADVPLGDGSGGYVLFIGAIRFDMGLYQMSRACRLLGIDFRVFGNVQPRSLSYFKSFEGIVDYRGSLGNYSTEKWKILGDAAIFAFPTLCCNASPLAPKEALLCGVPVLACPDGGVIDDIEVGFNGLLAKPDDLIVGLSDMLEKTWDRSAIQAAAVIQMNPIPYIDKLESLLQKVSQGTCWGEIK